MTDLLLTAFNAFADVEENPSEALLQRLLARSSSWPAAVHGEVLPTEYERAGRRIRELLAELRPKVWIGLGVARNEQVLRLERSARNEQACATADNAGEIRSGIEIVKAGPAVYRSNLDLKAMLGVLAECGIEARISDDAGRFVCNSVFYTALDEAQRSGTDLAAGFIHVPQRPLTSRLVDAAGRCVRIVLDEAAVLSEERPTRR